MATWALAPGDAWRGLMRRDGGRGYDAWDDARGSDAWDDRRRSARWEDQRGWDDPDDRWPREQDAWPRPPERMQAPGDKRQRLSDGGDLPPTQPVRSPESRRNIVIALACLGTALVLVLTLILISLPSGPATTAHSTMLANTTATTVKAISSGVPATATPNPKSFTPTPLPAAGWHSAGPSFAESIAFAPTDTNTAYACGPRGNGASVQAHNSPRPSGEPPMTLAVTHNAGATWQNLGSPFTGAHCSLSISPIAPNDLVMVSDSFGVGCAPCSNIDVYLSMDGGQHMQHMLLPPESSSDSQGPSIGAYTWVGTSLYTLVAYQAGDGGILPHDLAVSNNGGALQWTNEHVLPKMNGQAPVISAIIGTDIGPGQTLFAELTYLTCSCTKLASTTDGVTWMYEPFMNYQGLWSNVDGSLLFTQSMQGDTLFSSFDGGRSWHMLPSLPTTIPTDTGIYSTPDGTLYVAFQGVTGVDGDGVYRLIQHADAWAFAAALPAARFLLAVQWDSLGQPLALWGQATFNNTAGIIGPGLQRHAP